MPDLVAAAMLGGLVLYAVLGGADFGGGVWDLLARGPRADRQRALVERAIAPVWEANHVWLILVVTLLFTAFPAAFARLAIELHVPLSLALLGIVLRGSAFVFRHAAADDDVAHRRWGRVFAIASTVTPGFLGVTLGAITVGVGGAGVDHGAATALTTGMTPFTLVVGGFAIALFGFLAAVYLACEAAAAGGDDRAALADDFRRRALAAGGATIALAIAAAVAGSGDAARFTGRLIGSPWSAPLGLGFAVAAALAGWGLAARRFRAARAAAVAVVVLLIAGWGAAQYPVLVGPDLTIADAAAPAATLGLLGPILLVGSAILFPSLYGLLRVFKAGATPASGDSESP